VFLATGKYSFIHSFYFTEHGLQTKQHMRTEGQKGQWH